MSRGQPLRRILAESLNTIGSKFADTGKHLIGQRCYAIATLVDQRWSVPWYNLGLDYKNTGRWEDSLQCNQRAVELNPQDEAAWWNLGIAATALKNWPEARRAWKAYGMALEGDEGEVKMPLATACVRLDPRGSGEVVWGVRIDPARILISNVPYPESGFRFRDVVLNDGASNGTRADEDGNRVPVLDELALWQASEYSTFAVRLLPSDAASEGQLIALSHQNEVGIEDWSAVRILCAMCSRGNPGPHECVATGEDDGFRRFGFGAKSREDLILLLRNWVDANSACQYQEPQLLLSARRI